ncbi:Hypothetical predicted protein [Podarcis lilfordi]|uniref:Uncharacterized protein n=1 Tax=Podarcis lilfordi TaxID=74358 RepID=A0AA35K0N3_9SAUR|nr:Hypothetical predicted protein [Podarcis lilfordi]
MQDPVTPESHSIIIIFCYCTVYASFSLSLGVKTAMMEGEANKPRKSNTKPCYSTVDIRRQTRLKRPQNKQTTMIKQREEILM